MSPAAPVGRGAAIDPLSVSPATSAGAARVPDPKNGLIEVSWPPSGPFSAEAKMLSGLVSPSGAVSCATERVRLAAS